MNGIEFSPGLEMYGEGGIRRDGEHIGFIKAWNPGSDIPMAVQYTPTSWDKRLTLVEGIALQARLGASH